MRLLFGEQALEPEQQREAPSPADGGQLVPCVDLLERSIDRPATCGAGCQRLFEGLALVDELLTSEQLSARDSGGIGKRGGVTHEDRKVALRLQAAGAAWRP